MTPNVVQQQCELFRQQVQARLDAAADAESRGAVLRESLSRFAAAMFPHLERGMRARGEEDPGYLAEREAALELLTWLAIPYVRSLTGHGDGVAFFGSLVDACPDPILRRKLVIYTNQLKQGWNRVEPGGISHNPRGRANLPATDGAPSPMVRLLTVGLLAAIAYLVISSGIVSINLPGGQERGSGSGGTSAPSVGPVSVTAPAADGIPVPQHQVLVQGESEQLSAEAPSPSTSPSVSYYSYTDGQGVVHMVSDPDAVPARYRSRMRAVEAPPAQHSTPVAIRGNRVLVPVTLTFRGRTVNATLLLDTGATVTTINESLVSRLGVASGDVQQGRARVADGRYVDTYSFSLDSLAVGGRSQSQVLATFVAGSGGSDHDGLLGMNFLRNYRYHIDFNRSVIEWGT